MWPLGTEVATRNSRPGALPRWALHSGPAVAGRSGQDGEGEAAGSVSSRRREAVATPVIATPASSAAPAIISDELMSELPVLGKDPAACWPPLDGEPGPATSIELEGTVGWGGYGCAWARPGPTRAPAVIAAKNTAVPIFALRPGARLDFVMVRPFGVLCTKCAGGSDCRDGSEATLVE